MYLPVCVCVCVCVCVPTPLPPPPCPGDPRRGTVEHLQVFSAPSLSRLQCCAPATQYPPLRVRAYVGPVAQPPPCGLERRPLLRHRPGRRLQSHPASYGRLPELGCAAGSRQCVCGFSPTPPPTAVSPSWAVPLGVGSVCAANQVITSRYAVRPGLSSVYGIIT